MTFPPAFSLLKDNTLKLERDFSILIGRYQISEQEDPSEGLFESKTSTDRPKKNNQKRSDLEILIARTSEYVCNGKTKRSTAQDVFTQLISLLNNVVKGKKEEQSQQGAMFLLGALLHRYFRLIQEYDDYNMPTEQISYVASRFFFKKIIRIYDVRDCGLFRGIRAALALPNYTADGIDRFKKRDMEYIDVVTRVTALEVFQKNMLIIDKDRLPRFKKYQHLADDPNFEKHLQEIIEKQKALGTEEFRQYKAIRFVNSVVMQVESHYDKLKVELDKWNVLLNQSSNFTALNLETLEAHVKQHVIGPTKETILDLLSTDHIKSNIGTYNHTTFIAALLEAQNIIARHTVCGAYALLLESKGMDALKNCIYQALGIQGNTESLTIEKKQMCVQFFKDFVTNNTDIVFDYDYFGSKNKMNTCISQTLANLLNRGPQQSADEPLIVGAGYGMT